MRQDVRKLMGRLYPVVQQIRDGESRGSGVRLSPQDIAAAIGMLPDRIEKRIFLAINWPETVDIPSLVRDLHTDLFNRYSLLEIDYHREFCRRVSSGRPLEIDKERWKHSPRVYSKIPSACLVEICTGVVCESCYAEAEECPVCDGTGSTPLSFSVRADLLSISRRSLCRDWQAPYSWMLRKIKKAEELAARSLAAVLT